MQSNLCLEFVNLIFLCVILLKFRIGCPKKKDILAEAINDIAIEKNAVAATADIPRSTMTRYIKSVNNESVDSSQADDGEMVPSMSMSTRRASVGVFVFILFCRCFFEDFFIIFFNFTVV